MNLKDENWIKSFCNESTEKQKELIKESGLSYFLKEEDYDFFLARIGFYPKKLETILKIINNEDFIGYLYDNNSFIYKYLLREIFKVFTDYKKSFATYQPTLPLDYEFKAGRKNDFWFQLFVNNLSIFSEEETDFRYHCLEESKLALVLHLSVDNVNLFFKLINKEILIRILKILHDPQLIGYIYDSNSFIYNYIYNELSLLLSRIDGLTQTYMKKAIPNDQDLYYIDNRKHNELWIDSFVNSRIYYDNNGEEIDLKRIFFNEANLNLLIKEEHTQLFLKGMSMKAAEFKILLRTVHNEQLMEALKIDHSLVRNSVESILKNALGFNVYEMPIIEYQRKKKYKYTTDNFLSLSIEKQFEYFEYTGLNIFLKEFLEKEIKCFLKQMARNQENFKQILNFLDLNKDILQDSTSESYKQAYELLLPFFQRIFGTNRFAIEEYQSEEEQTPKRTLL